MDAICDADIDGISGLDMDAICDADIDGISGLTWMQCVALTLAAGAWRRSTPSRKRSRACTAGWARTGERTLFSSPLVPCGLLRPHTCCQRLHCELLLSEAPLATHCAAVAALLECVRHAMRLSLCC
eukprot:3729914-Rhodomonas_salina.3